MHPPILIAGPTASGKSALALELAARDGGCVINADAMQTYACWQILTARPSPADETRAPHRLFGTVPADAVYSVGDWLRDVEAALAECRTSGLRPIIVGGTGLYFAALTKGLAVIPSITKEIRAAGDTIRHGEGAAGFVARLRQLDTETLAKTDRNNPVRLQRAWEVVAETGRGLAAWQKETSAPLVDIAGARTVILESDPVWTNGRISARLDRMIADGVLTECAAVVDAGWNPAAQSSRALGAVEFVAHLSGALALDEAKEIIIVKTRRYAKRQRTWFRNQMAGWTRFDPASGTPNALARHIT